MENSPRRGIRGYNGRESSRDSQVRQASLNTRVLCSSPLRSLLEGSQCHPPHDATGYGEIYENLSTTVGPVLSGTEALKNGESH